MSEKNINLELESHKTYKYERFNDKAVSNLVGTKFYDCEFGLKFNFEYCPQGRENKGLEFHNCKFLNTEFNGDGTPAFIDCKFIHCEFINSNSAKTAFRGRYINCIFTHIVFKDVSFDLVRFYNCQLTGVYISGGEIEENYQNSNFSNMTFGRCTITSFSSIDIIIKGVISFNKMKKQDINNLIDLTRIEIEND